jgi:hypothetical protein
MAINFICILILNVIETTKHITNLTMMIKLSHKLWSKFEYNKTCDYLPKMICGFCHTYE